MREPLLHIGYHKTGSSWLQDQIFGERRFGFVKAPTPSIDAAFIVQNPFAFDASKARATFKALLDEASTHDLVPVLSHERLSGDVGTGGVDSRMIADRLAEAFPSGRVLIVIREQREMLLSVYKTWVRFSPNSLERWWREQSLFERRRPGPRLEYFEYHHLISYYQRIFGRDHVLVLPYEVFRRDPLAFVSEVSKFSGLPAPMDVPSVIVNPSSPAALLALVRVMNVVLSRLGLDRFLEGPLEERRTKRAQLRAMDALAPYVPRSLSRRVDRRWRATIERITGDRYAQSNRITSELTGFDLTALGYVTKT